MTQLCRAPLDKDSTVAAWALYLRSLFGGMKGDTRMLHGACAFMLGPAADASVAPALPDTAAVAWSSVPALNSPDRGLEVAVDFHCFPPMLGRICAATGCSEDQVRTLMWTQSSGVNLRRTATVPNYSLQDHHSQIARAYLRNLFGLQ